MKVNCEINIRLVLRIEEPHIGNIFLNGTMISAITFKRYEIQGNMIVFYDSNNNVFADLRDAEIQLVGIMANENREVKNDSTK